MTSNDRHDEPAMQREPLDLFAFRHGHFLLESGHHSDFWLDLELLCLQPARTQRLAQALAKDFYQFDLDAVCGPLVDGAFVALMTAMELDVEFYYAERSVVSESASVSRVEYRIAPAQRCRLSGKRVAIVDDVINAGSAVRAVFADLQSCGAHVAALGALLVLGSSPSALALEMDTPLRSIASLPNAVWTASQCPLCASSMPLEEMVH